MSEATADAGEGSASQPQPPIIELFREEQYQPADAVEVCPARLASGEALAAVCTYKLDAEAGTKTGSVSFLSVDTAAAQAALASGGGASWAPVRLGSPVEGHAVFDVQWAPTRLAASAVGAGSEASKALLAVTTSGARVEVWEVDLAAAAAACSRKEEEASGSSLLTRRLGLGLTAASHSPEDACWEEEGKDFDASGVSALYSHWLPAEEGWCLSSEDGEEEDEDDDEADEATKEAAAAARAAAAAASSSFSSSSSPPLARLAVSRSDGCISLLSLTPSSLRSEATWLAHAHPCGGATAEVWVVSGRASEPHMLWSGGDDAYFKAWDLRTRLSLSFAAVKVGPSAPGGHESGVTAIAWHPRREHWLATGSYDETAALWDARALRRGPVVRWEAGGGVWRLKWAPRPGPHGQERLLAACMYNGFKVIDVLSAEGCEGASFVEVAADASHGSIAYGGDWLGGAGEDERPLFATCSFYDRLLRVWGLGGDQWTAPQ